MAADVGKPPFDAWLTDLLVTRVEAEFALDHLDRGMKPTKYPVPVLAQPAATTARPVSTPSATTSRCCAARPAATSA